MKHRSNQKAKETSISNKLSNTKQIAKTTSSQYRLVHSSTNARGQVWCTTPASIISECMLDVGIPNEEGDGGRYEDKSLIVGQIFWCKQDSRQSIQRCCYTLVTRRSFSFRELVGCKGCWVTVSHTVPPVNTFGFECHCQALGSWNCNDWVCCLWRLFLGFGLCPPLLASREMPIV